MEIVDHLKKLVAQERRITVEILLALREVERQKIFAQMGYSSLFVFCCKELKYSEPAAYRRISAMRLLKSHAEIQEKMIQGDLTLTNAARVQTEFRKTGDQPNLLAAAYGKSTRELDELFEEKPPSPLKERLRQLKALWSHKFPGISDDDLLLFLVNQALEKSDPARMRCDSGAGGKARYIPTKLKAAIWKRDGGKCTYKNCGSTYFLELDHIVPLAHGGKSTADNLRLLCRTHNQLAAIEAGFPPPPLPPPPKARPQSAKLP